MTLKWVSVMAVDLMNQVKYDRSCLEGSDVIIQAEIGDICCQFRISQVLNIISYVTHGMNVPCSLVKVLRTVIYSMSLSAKSQNIAFH